MELSKTSKIALRMLLERPTDIIPRKLFEDIRFPAVRSVTSYKLMTSEDGICKDIWKLDFIPSLSECDSIIHVLTDLRNNFKAVNFNQIGIFGLAELEQLKRLHSHKEMQKCVVEEKRWFKKELHLPSENCLQPDNLAVKELFSILQENSNGAVIYNRYIITQDIASICCNRWFSMGLMRAFVDLLNCKGSHTRAFILNETEAVISNILSNQIQLTPTNLNIEHLLVIVNIGKNSDGTTFISDSNRKGCHWTLLDIDIKRKKYLYCDSLAWQVPSDLWMKIMPLCDALDKLCGSTLRKPSLRNADLIKSAHSSGYMNSRGQHECGPNCLQNIPLQSCMNLCGAIVVSLAAICVLHQDIWKILQTTKECIYDPGLWFQKPSEHAEYIRKCLCEVLAKKEFPDSIFGLSSDYCKEIIQTIKNQNEMKSYIPNLNSSAIPSEKRHNLKTKPNRKRSYVVVSTNVPTHVTRKTQKHGEHDNISSDDEVQSSDMSMQPTEEVQSEPNRTDAHSTDLESQPHLYIEERSSDIPMYSSSNVSFQSDTTIVGENGPGARSINCANEDEKTLTRTKDKTKVYQCPLCSKTFTHRNGLYKHKKNKHTGEYQLGKEQEHVQCYICKDYRCRGTAALVEHLHDVHDKDVEVKTTTFADMDEFMCWKEQIEKDTSSWFVRHRENSEARHHTTSYYYCNRTGNVKTTGNGKRSMKIQGSSKMNRTCSAFMKAKQEKESKQVYVEYCVKHVGHESKLGHLRISDDLRKKIAGKLAKKIPVEAVLDEIRDNIDGNLSRDHLISKQDVYNIMHQYNISAVQKHSQDATSVHCWVAELQSQEYNSILCYKPQGEQKYGLPPNDFLLGIQTEFQRDLMLEQAENLVCLDSTHCTTGYDFLLVTVLVKDHFGEGVPVAWLITNCEDICSLDPFFAALRERIGDINVKDFMSDDADAFCNAWSRNFAAPRRQLICSWHVDKNIRKNIMQKVKGAEEQAILYKCIKTVITETDEVQFKIKLQELCAYIDENHSEFYQYFKTQFLSRQSRWAYCYRKSTAANTNMALESFHRVLKVVYLHRKRNKRVDHLLCALLKIARDKAFEAWEKWEKGKRTNKIQDINKRHKTALTLDTSGLIEVTEDQWELQSSTVKGTSYSITRNTSCSGCKMKCTSCDVCIHEYTCSCPDYMIHAVPCKHIHAIHIKYANTEITSESYDVDEALDDDNSTNKRGYFESQIQMANKDEEKKKNPLQNLKRAIAGAAEEFFRKVDECEEPEALNAAYSHLNNAIAVLDE
eukprot:gene17246-18967_t